MKRPVITAIALSLATLAIAAAAPIAVAAPMPSFTPSARSWTETDRLTTTPETHVLRATATPPTSRTGTVTISVTGARPGERVEGSIEPSTDTESIDTNQIQAIVRADDRGRATITLPAPAEGWSARKQYAWVAAVLGRDAMDRGHFTTPVWPDAAEPPAATFRAAVQLPKTKNEPVVFTMVGARPGKVTVVFGRSTLGSPELETSADVAADGRANVRVHPASGGWDSGERYVWYATSGELSSTGSLTMPTWSDDGKATERPGSTTTTKPRDNGGGLARTGV